MSYDITVEGGTSKRLLTAGKYCDRDIIITATAGEIYTPLEYLEGDGNQWIDTGISGGTNASYELLFQHTEDKYPIESYDYLFAGAKSGYVPFITYYTWNGFHTVVNGAFDATFAYKKDAKDITAGLRYNSDGTVYSKWGSEDWKQLSIDSGNASAVAGKGWGNKNWYIFNCPEENNIITMRLYYLKMYTDGELVRDFVPVRRGSDGECGLLDNVSGKFFGNAGAGAFTGGGAEEDSGGTNYDLFNDGDTHIWITLQEGRTSPIMGLGVLGTATIDWGDGSAIDTLTGTNANTVVFTPRHEYPAAGDYIIRITASNTVTLLGAAAATTGGYVLRYSSSADVRNAAYRHSIKQVELGDTKFKMSTAAFYQCGALERLFLPYKSNSVGTNVFNNCLTMKHVDVAAKTSIGSYMFYNCQSLVVVTIPKEVTTIAANAFYGCSSVLVFDFSNHTSVPTLDNVSAFTNIPADCEFRVPAELYDEWVAVL